MAASEIREPARTTGYHKRGRAVEAMALDMLRRKGYTVVRSRRSSSLVHLVAWCDRSRPVFLHVKRTRRIVAGAVDVASIWKDDIRALQGLPGGTACRCSCGSIPTGKAGGSTRSSREGSRR